MRGNKEKLEGKTIRKNKKERKKKKIQGKREWKTRKKRTNGELERNK